jgi:hypothetical protein
VGWVTRWLSVREVRASEKASHRGHGGHRGELERGSGLGDMVASSARSARFGESIAQRSQRPQRGIGEGNLAIGKLSPESALFGPDHDLHATIELLLVHRLVGRHDQARLTEPLCLDSIRIDVHVADYPRFYRFGSALAEVHVVLVAAERISMPFHPEDCLGVAFDQAP